MIKAVSQFLQMCRNIRIKFISCNFLGKRLIQTNPSKFDKRLFSDVYLCRLHLKHGKENLHDFIFWSFWHKHFFIFFVIVGRTRQATKDTLQYALCVFGAVNTQGFVWNFFYALYINFHSFIHIITEEKLQKQNEKF